jgi:hypothetical protein
VNPADTFALATIMEAQEAPRQRNPIAHIPLDFTGTGSIRCGSREEHDGLEQRGGQASRLEEPGTVSQTPAGPDEITHGP